MQEQIWNRVFQFSPPRGGRRRALHRPGGGATISILAPAWGRPRLPVMPGISPSYFNSRPRVGGVDVKSKKLGELAVFQFSPPRGGRPVTCARDAVFPNFNSRPRVGGVGMQVYLPLSPLISILAPAWGASLEHTHVAPGGVTISILAPAWGASTQDFKVFVKDYISILAPAWGASTAVAVV